MDSCPKELEPYEIAYEEKLNRKDIENWQTGQYLLAAIATAFSKEKYPKKPMFQIERKKSDNKNREGNEEIAVFEMKQRTKLLEKSGMPTSPA